MGKFVIQDISGKKNIELEDYKLEDYKVKIIINKIVSDSKGENYYPLEMEVNYDKSYKKIIKAKAIQTGFTMNCSIMFIDDVNKHQDGDYHYITFEYGRNFPEDYVIVNDILKQIENFLEESKTLNCINK